MDLEIINPQQNDCSKKTAQKVINLFKHQADKNMVNSWPNQAEQVIKQMKAGNLRLAIMGGEVIGCVIVKEYSVSGWGRMSWPFVQHNCRYIGIEQELVWHLCQDYHKSFRLIMPVRAPINQSTVNHLGFQISSFARLQENFPEVWQRTCVCHNTESCLRADKDCLLLLR